MTSKITAKDVIRVIKANADPIKALSAANYFKTGKGEYGEGDIFLGLTVPARHAIAQEFAELAMPEISILLSSRIHECRSMALMILEMQFVRFHKQKNEKECAQIVRFYLAHKKYINNWDLVDGSAPHIFGRYLFDHPKKRSILYTLAHSKNLWDKRIGIIATQYFIGKESYTDTLVIAEILVHDSHDLIHKAVGWMLREVGKRSPATEEKFLNEQMSIH